MARVKDHLDELDSLRGVASLSVVLYHATSLLGIAASLPFLFYTPWQVLMAGHQAVIFFFVLSGFVLALPYTVGRPRSYRTFLIRRVCRLYPPYIAAVIFGLVMRLLFSHIVINSLWTGRIGWVPFLHEVLMIDQFHQRYFDPVVWSLVVEIRMALFFPFLIWFILRVNWRWSLLTGFLLSACGIVLHVHYQSQVDFFTNYFDTAHYALMFIAGALLAKHRAELLDWFRVLGMRAKILMGMGAFVLYTWTNPILWTWGLAGDLVSDWFTMLASCYFVLASLSSARFREILHMRPLQFLGRISFSLYLVHLVVLLTLMNVLSGVVSPYIIMVGVVAISILLASVSYRYLEEPSILLGRILTQPNFTHHAHLLSQQGIREGK